MGSDSFSECGGCVVRALGVLTNSHVRVVLTPAHVLIHKLEVLVRKNTKVERTRPIVIQVSNGHSMNVRCIYPFRSGVLVQERHLGYTSHLILEEQITGASTRRGIPVVINPCMKRLLCPRAP